MKKHILIFLFMLRLYSVVIIDCDCWYPVTAATIDLDFNGNMQ